ncbi:helix-turn-helix transcriptional regulator [Actinospica durhamensis]|uniref:Helix-turn-helix transcriptional regulator n=1 Tax=Actinospica durhamensis TaxID=1508375 RepID=A0A941EKJ6_9ACTN|nr:helix-turn-helix transcriptional regulator [Actinospica durhamensis]MBR7834170.1 helix-turn-helix transcriptional regulator [Actinospica durhamensis]
MEPISRMTDATLDVLEALMGPDDQLYGLKIAQQAGRKTGVVYPVLARLEDAGWVTSEWELDTRGERGPRRRFYRLSPDGLGAARAALAERRGAASQRPERVSRRRPVLPFVALEGLRGQR